MWNRSGQGAGHGNSQLDRARRDVEAAEVEKDGGGEAVLVAEAAAPGLDGLDAAVDALGRAVGGVEDDGVDDAPQVPSGPSRPPS